MNNLLENLNPEQLKAVTHKEGPLLIVAGAGTGKTTVITQRLAYLIEQSGVKPDEILALTFTEKAAEEMEERVDRLLPFGYLDLWISTFHGFAQRILGDHGLAIGLPSDFKLLNEFEQWALIKKNLDKFDLDYYRPLGNPAKFIRALVKHFSRLKDEDICPADYLKYAEELKENLDGMLGGVQNSKLKTQNSKLHVKTQKLNSKFQNSKQVENYKEIENRKSEIENFDIPEQEVARINELANAYHVYQQLLLDNNTLDFGDLINYCLKLFRERPAILEKYREQFKYILVDEFQDTNWSQYELIKLLAAPKNLPAQAGNLVVSADDDQSIYRFRGASMSNVLQFFNDYSQAKKIILVKNYRNKQNILDLSYEFIKLNNPNRLEWQLENPKIETPFPPKADPPLAEIPPACAGRLYKGDKARLQPPFKGGGGGLNKKLVAQKKGEGVIEVLEGDDLADEVRQVVIRIAELKIRSRLAATRLDSARLANGDHANEKNNEVASWNDFAILVRANDSAKSFCNALEEADLPYQFLAFRGLYAKSVIMDVIAYFKLLDNYHESVAMYRVLNLPIFDFSSKELADFNHLAAKKAWSLYEVLLNLPALDSSSASQKKAVKVVSLINKHTSLAREKGTNEVMLAFLSDSGYLKYISGFDEAKQKEQFNYLNQFMKRIKDFEKGSDDKSVKAFLNQLDMEIEAGEEGVLSPDLETGPEAIKVMTIHSAKGLEFKYVFIVNLVDKRFPTIERHELIAVPDPLIKEVLPVGDIHLEEERRLFYVAMTRAKAGLYFSWARDYGGTRKKKPSRFLVECNLVKKQEPFKKSYDKLGELKIKNQKIEIISKKDKKINYSLPPYYSYTQLAAYDNCPYQYKFAHLLKVPVRGKYTYSFGQTMHITLQKLFNSIKEKGGLDQQNLFSNPLTSNPSPVRASRERGVEENFKKININFDEVLKLYEGSWIDDWYESKSRKEQYKNKGKEILRVFYEKHKNNWPSVYALEQTFNLKVGGKTIYGKIDRIDEVDGGVQLVDYKTGIPKTEEKINQENKMQLLIYQIAAQEVIGKTVKNLQFYFLDNNSEFNFLGSGLDIKDIKEKIIKRIKLIEESIKNDNFPPHKGKLCRYCDFWDICEFRQN